MASVSSSKDPREMYALKQRAVKYYQDNGVPAKMEEILNTMFYEDPTDVYGYLTNYFSQFVQSAKLHKLKANQVFDSTGSATIQTDIYCIVNNLEKLVSSSTIPSANIHAKPEDREKAEVDAQHSIAEAVKVIENDINVKLIAFDPVEQKEIDDLLLTYLEGKKEDELNKKLAEEDVAVEDHPAPPPPADDKEKKKSAKASKKHEDIEGGGGRTSAPIPAIPDRPQEVFVTGCEAAAAVSQAVCVCAAQANFTPLYRHIGNTARAKGALHEFRLPLPLVTIIQSGKTLPGKVNCVKDYMLVPGITMSVEKSVEHIQHIYHYVAKSYASKLGAAAKFVNESGALCPSLDTPTQALDLLQEAVNAQGLTIGEDIHLVINAAAHEFFDIDKGKYEVVTGQTKSPDEMVEFWADIVSKYPSILAIIDPIRGEDQDAWMRLCERLSEGLLLIGDRFYDRPGRVLKEEEHLTHPIKTSGIVLKLEKLNTISDIIECANTFSELNNEIVISTNEGETTDTFIVDLAVGVSARFLKVGGPNRGERTCKLNRLLEIYRELEPPETTELPTAEDEQAAEAETERKDSQQRSAGTEADEGADLKIDVTAATESEGQIRSESQGNAFEEEDEEECEEEDEGNMKESERWGENEKSRLKLHTPFTFPLIENPPAPGEPEEEGEKTEKMASPSGKKMSISK